MLNYFLSLLGLSPVNWTGLPGTALLSIMMADIWGVDPFHGHGHAGWIAGSAPGAF